MAEAVEDCVQSIVATIRTGQQNEGSLITQNSKATKSPKSTKMKSQESVRGQPKSGRFWKSKKER